MSKKLEALKARLAAKDEEGKPEEGKPEEGKPAAGENPEDEKPSDGETSADPPPADPPPAPEAPENPDAPSDGDDDEDKPAARKALAMLERRLDDLAAENAKLASENGRLRAVLADPSFAAALMKGETVPASAAEPKPRMSRAEADEAYAKLATPAERAAFRRAHAEELGLR